jgi:hypothetical protein
MSRVKSRKKGAEIVLPPRFDIYRRIEKEVENLERKFQSKYELTDITVGVSITASISPSLTGSVSATLTKKKP